MLNKVKNTIGLTASIIKKVVKDPSLLKKNMTRKVFNRIFTSNLQTNKYDIIKDLKEFPVIEFPHFDKPLVSIIVPAYNKWEYTYACFLSILKHVKNVSYEVILADDVSTDETKNAEKYVKNLIAMHNEVNLRFVKNNNKAAKLAKGKYIAMLNNDTNVQEDWLESMVELLENDETIGVVGSKLIYTDGRLQEAGNIVWQNGVPENYGNLYNPHSHEYTYVKEVDYVTGASLISRREIWEKLGGLDEDLTPGYFDDSDYCFSVRKLGYRIVYQPLSQVIHYEGVTHGRSTKNFIKAYQEVNYHKFVAKWKSVFEKEGLPQGTDFYWARDRSRNKKTLVVIDSRVPLYDREAGSRSTFNYLKLFVQMGFNVKFIANSLSRYEPYTTDLEQLGIEVLYAHSDNAKDWIKENAKYIDYVYIHRPDIADIYLDFVKQNTHAKIWYQTHDLHFLREQRRYEIEKDESALKESKRLYPLEKRICESVDAVLTFSEYEKQVIEKEFSAKNVHVVPLYLYSDFSDHQSTPFEKRNGLLFVGGFGHFPNQDGLLWFVNEILPIVKKQIPDIKLTIVGSNPPEVVQNLASDSIKLRQNISDEELTAAHDQTKLLIVPLRYGAGVKGKVVDALYHGNPMVSTGVGLEGITNIDSIVKPSDSAEDFANQVIKLYANPTELTNLSKKYRAFAKEYFSEDTAKNIFTKLMSV